MTTPVETNIPWDNKFCLDVALGLDSTEDILRKYNVSPQQYEQWSKHPLFQRAVVEYQQQARDSGVSFKLRARIQAEDLLNVSYKLIYNPDVPAAVRADLIKWTAKMGDLEPSSKEGSNAEMMTQKTLMQALEKMADGDLEISVMKVLKKRENTQVIEGEVISKDEVK